MTFYRLLGWSCINLTWTVALYNARLDDIPGREGGKKGIFIHQKKKKLQKKKREKINGTVRYFLYYDSEQTMLTYN